MREVYTNNAACGGTKITNFLNGPERKGNKCNIPGGLFDDTVCGGTSVANFVKVQSVAIVNALITFP